MAVTHEDVTELKKVFDDRYVLQADCNDIQAKNNNRFANDDKRIEKQEEFNASLKRFMWIGLTVLCGEVIISFLNLLKDTI